MNHVRITSNGTGTAGTVEIDGTDVAGSVRSLRLTAGVGEITELTLEVMPRRIVEFEGDAYVRLNYDFEEFLVKLGWTPPHRP